MLTSGHDEHASNRGVRTGFVCLDHLVPTLAEGTVTLLAGRPGMGKTSLALNIVRNVAKDQGRTVVIFSLELTKQAVERRLLSMEAGLDVGRVSRGVLGPDEQGRLYQAGAMFRTVRIFVHDDPSPSIGDIRARIEELMAAEGDLGLVVIDYLQLMSGEETCGDECLQLSLKAAAMGSGLPFLVLAQLPRSVEERADHRPVLSDVDHLYADTVLLLHREEVFDPGRPDRGTVEVIVGSRERGILGSCRLGFDPGCGRLSDPWRQE
jgi:replicative DNA helicase